MKMKNREQEMKNVRVVGFPFPVPCFSFDLLSSLCLCVTVVQFFEAVFAQQRSTSATLHA